jgi:vacuolar-type H+-ATPase subunit H
MDRDILNEVINAEKEIQERIEREQSRLRELEQCAQREADESVARAAQEMQESLERDGNAARQDAEARARTIVDDATALAGRLERLDDRELIDIVLKRLPRILIQE